MNYYVICTLFYNTVKNFTVKFFTICPKSPTSHKVDYDVGTYISLY